MKPVNRIQFIIAFICVASLPMHAEDNLDEPTLLAPILAMVPQSIHRSKIENPRVVAKIQVSGHGSVEDVVVIEASHVGLVDRAEKLIKEARFRMPEEGTSSSYQFDLHLPFHYPSDLGVSSISPSDDIRMVMSGFTIVGMNFKLHVPQELDTPPKVIDRGQVYRPDDDKGKPISGSAMVQFYVNHLGEVRLPKVLSSTHPEVAQAAIGTVSDMKFAPPTVDGEPTVTILQMPFSVK